MKHAFIRDSTQGQYRHLLNGCLLVHRDMELLKRPCSSVSSLRSKDIPCWIPSEGLVSDRIFNVVLSLNKPICKTGSHLADDIGLLR